MSDSIECKEVETFKNFLGAFGQPGIVVCLEDTGSNIMDILKKSARSVDAIGRGTVECYYWKRLTESSCGGDPGWGQLARIEDQPLISSQLDYVPKGWLSDAGDWCEIFANLVSPEISTKYEKKIQEMFSDNKGWIVKAGPPKTLARCRAKGREYLSDFASKC